MDGRTLATSGENHTIRLWNIETGEERFNLRRLIRGEADFSSSPDGRSLASLDTGDEIALWDIAAMELGFTIGPIASSLRRVRFSPEGTCLATCGKDFGKDWVVVLWLAPRAE